MSYNVVIPASYQTDRQDLDAALTQLIDAFIVSESYEVGRKWKDTIPDTFTGEGPLIVLGDVLETIQHTMQLRITVFTGTIFYVDWLTARGEVHARVSRWADRMRDLFTYNVQVTGKGELRQTGFMEGEFKQGQLLFAAPSIQFEYEVQEGYR